jgi:transposase-like protein
MKTLGIESLSKSRVSRMASQLDEMVTQFRNRPLDAGPYTYVWMDVLSQEVREGGRIINVAVVIAVEVNRDGGSGGLSALSPQRAPGRRCLRRYRS